MVLGVPILTLSSGINTTIPRIELHVAYMKHTWLVLEEDQRRFLLLSFFLGDVLNRIRVAARNGINRLRNASEWHATALLRS